MKLKELFEGEVIQAKFGQSGEEKFKPAGERGIDIPKGYVRFEVEDTTSGKSANIIGVKKDGSKKKISTADKNLARALVKMYNSGEAPDSLQPVSAFDAFASGSEKAIKDIARLYEKPSGWAELDKPSQGYKPLTDFDIKRAEKALGHKLKIYSAVEIFGTNARPKGPLVDLKKKPNEQMCIIEFTDAKYLVDTSAANTYIRMWARIK